MAQAVHGACPHDCYDTCGLTLEAEGGRITRVAGDADQPITRGFLCLKVNRYLERLYHPDRVLHPLLRVGAKGQGRFARVTWDEALAAVAEGLRRVIERHGGEAVLPYSFAGNMGLLATGALDARFFRAIGASQLDRTICTASGNAALRWVFGACLGPDPETIPLARTVVLWGANAMATNVHQIPLLDEARRAGGEIWTIDPLRTATAQRYDRHLAPRPGSDLELALGLGRELIATGRWDRELVLERSDGFEAYRRLAEPWTLGRTADATGLDEAALGELAQRLAAEGPLLLRVGYGVQRQRRSAATVWAIAVLSLLTGSWRQVGGGLLLSNGDAFPLRPLAGGGPRPERHVNMIELGRALTELANPPVGALVVYNSNPAATAPDQARVLRGLAREDLFTVVHEQMMTDTAKWADVVLPAAMAMETTDLHTSYWHRYVQLARPATPPAGEAVSNPELFRRLARAMGLSDPALQADDLTLIREALDVDHPWLGGITLEALVQAPVQKVRLDAASRPFLDTPVATPGGRFRLAPPPGTAVGGPVAAEDEAYPLSLLTPAAHETIKSSFGNVASLRRGHPRPELLMAAEDMARLGIRDGQEVRAHNARGAVRLTAVQSAVPQPGTVVSYAVRWNHEGGGKNVNQLTSADAADFGGGATFYSARVAVEPAG